MLAPDAAVTAVLCGNDDLALGVMRAMHEAGRQPSRRGQRGRLRRQPVAGFFTPALTTVRLDFAELGRACFALLQAFLDPETAVPPAPGPSLN